MKRLLSPLPMLERTGQPVTVSFLVANEWQEVELFRISEPRRHLVDLGQFFSGKSRDRGPGKLKTN